jgi:hypothetical protein
MNENKCRAYHEAAHAVAVVRFNKLLNCVSIASSTTRGHHRSGSNPEEDVIVCLAGYVAEIRLCPELEMQSREAAQGDFTSVAELLPKLKDQNIETWIAYTRSFVERNWSVISIVAEALLQRGTLFGKEVKLLIRSVDEGSKPTLKEGDFYGT